MTWFKMIVSPLLMHWICHCLALSHPYINGLEQERRKFIAIALSCINPRYVCIIRVFVNRVVLDTQQAIAYTSEK